MVTTVQRRIASMLKSPGLWSSIIVVVATYIVSSRVFEARIVTYDNTVHFANASRFVEQLLSGEGLHSWTHEWFAGYPNGYFYPVVSYLPTALIYLASFGTLSTSEAYTVNFALYILFCPLALLWAGRKLFQSYSIGIAAALFYLLDDGTNEYGGWFFNVVVGVWPQGLSHFISLVAFVHFYQLLSGRGTKFAPFSISLALAFLSHPSQGIMWLFYVPFAVALQWTVEGGPNTRERLRPISGGLVVCALLCCAWLLPYLFSSDAYVSPTSTRSQPLSVGSDPTQIVSLDSLFSGIPFFITAFGLVGFIRLLKSGRALGLQVVLWCVLALLLAQNFFVDTLHLTVLKPVFTKVLFGRFGGSFRILWYLIAAYGATWMVAPRMKAGLRATFTKLFSNPRSSWRSVLPSGLLWVGTIWIIYPHAATSWNTYINSMQRKLLTTVDSRPDTPELKEVARWLNSNVNDPKHFFRVGIMTLYHEFDDLVTMLDMPVYKLGFTPATHFAYKVNDSHEQLIKYLNLRYFIVHTTRIRDFTIPNTRLIRHFSNFVVYEYTNWNPNLFSVIEGSGEINMVAFSPNRIEFDVQPGASGRIMLAVSYFSRWRLKIDDQPEELIGEPLLDIAKTSFLTMPLRPGTYVLTFEKGWPEYLGYVLSLIGLGIIAFSVVIKGNPLEQRWPETARKVFDIAKRGLPSKTNKSA